jgi:hypothetical protein
MSKFDTYTVGNMHPQLPYMLPYSCTLNAFSYDSTGTKFSTCACTAVHVSHRLASAPSTIYYSVYIVVSKTMETIDKDSAPISAP